MISGWANYFTLGQVGPAYAAVDTYAAQRLQQWFCRRFGTKEAPYCHMKMNLDEFLEEAIPLIAEDLRNARARLGRTSTSAATRTGISASRYRMLESGRARNPKQDLAEMISVAKHLGLESVRMSYVDVIDQYMRVSTAGDGPLAILFDTLDSSVAELREQGYFISPHRVLDFVNREGIGPLLDSRQRAHKAMVELWITAIFTLSLDGDREYYVRLVRDDPPDTEVLITDKKTRDLQIMRVEVTQHGRYSTSMTEVVGTKLRKSYEEGTVILVLVEEAQEFGVFDLYDFIQKNNPHGHRVEIIGGAGEAGQFRVLHWDPTGERATAVTVDTNDGSSGRCEYDGVVFKPPYTSRFRHVLPAFIRTVELHRE